MDLGRAVDTQRHALLRLLAGWAIVVEILSAGPFGGVCPRRVRGFIASLLDRAEAAAGFLVIATARLLIAAGKVAPEDARAFEARGARSSARYRDSIDAALPLDPAHSCDSLRMRIKALRGLLMSLPRRALRLLRQCSASRLAACPAAQAQGLTPGRFTERGIAARRVERPPDKPVLCAMCL